jgi:hypothetical protein
MTAPTTVTLLDGTQVEATSEAWKHLCEARMIANRPTLGERREYLLAVERSRGKPEADRLKQTLKTIWEQRNK